MIATSIRSTSDYIDSVHAAILNHWMIPEPQTVAELKAVIQSHPDVARRFLPNRAELRRMGLSTNSCREIEPFPIEFRERLLRTLAVDADFRGAVASLIGGAV